MSTRSYSAEELLESIPQAFEEMFKVPQTFEDEPFSEKWPFASEVKKNLGAWGYTIEADPDGRRYSSGRLVLVFKFYSGNGAARKILATHDGMCLTSKKGNPYHVVSRTSRRVAGTSAA
jgi:hypothetical protein